MLEQPSNPKSKIYIISSVAAIIIVLVIVGVLINKRKAEPDAGKRQSAQLTSQPKPVIRVNPAQPEFGGAVSIKPISAVALGAEVVVEIRLDTGGKNITLTRIYLDFDPELLKFIELDATGSVLAMKLSDEQTEASIVMSRGNTGDADYQDDDDGFTGSDGLFGRVIFEAVGRGEAKISLRPGQTKMFLDDGYGTQLQLDLRGVEFEIK